MGLEAGRGLQSEGTRDSSHAGQSAYSVIGNLSTVNGLMIPVLSQKVGLLSQKPDLRVSSAGQCILRQGTVEKKKQEEDGVCP